MRGVPGAGWPGRGRGHRHPHRRAAGAAPGVGWKGQGRGRPIGAAGRAAGGKGQVQGAIAGAAPAQGAPEGDGQGAGTPSACWTGRCPEKWAALSRGGSRAWDGGGRGPATGGACEQSRPQGRGRQGPAAEAGGEDGRGLRRMLAPGHDPHRCHAPEPSLSPTSSMASGISTPRQTGFPARPLS